MPFPWFKKNKPVCSENLTELKRMLDEQKNVTLKPSTVDETILSYIREKTRLANRNNITRTNAYLSFYRKHPEIHWAFLAHMVSRNAGWNMTDLKGTCLPRLLSRKEIEGFFQFLELGNWLIFQDAYPQLLMYEESIKQGHNLSYLLPHLFVSRYMETLMKQPTIQNEVVGKLEFTLQDILSMNQILFPYFNETKAIAFCGKTIHHFEDLNSRISIGKSLYSILFNEAFLTKVEQWAYHTLHSGSRKDYWSHLFNNVNEELPGKLYQIRLKECKLIPGSPRFYSPSLNHVWKDVSHDIPRNKDWYSDSSVVYHMLPNIQEKMGNVGQEYCKTLEKLELACVAKKVLPLF